MSYSDYRKNIQSILRNAGIYGGAIDGVWGPKSKGAMDELATKQDAEDTSGRAIPDLMHNGCYTGILDLSHGNNLDLGTVIQSGFGAIIHKASEGITFRDPKYAARKSAAMSAGLLWGAYHFAAFGDGAAQARNFLSVEDGVDPRVLLCLDFEPSSNGGENMTLAQARQFISTVHAATGRTVMIYGGGGLLRDLLEGSQDLFFAASPLWLADYRPNPRTIAPTWPEWTLLQYTDGESGQEPKATPGSDGADRNAFKGTLADLRKAWPFA